MKHEFTKIKGQGETRYVLETASAGATGAGAVATVSKPLGGVRKRDNILAQEADKTAVPAEKPRNFVAKNAKMGGAGQHRDKKKEQKQGKEKHKKPFAEQGVAEGSGFDKWADDRAASQLYKLNIPKTWEVSYDYGPHMTKTITVKARSEDEARAKVEKAAEKKGMSIMINSVEEQGVAEASPETTLNLLKGLKSWQVVIMNNYYRGKYSDYSGRYYYVLASNPEEAKQVVLDNADAILQELLAMKSHNGRKILPRGSALRITADRIGEIKDGTEAGRMTTAGFKKMFSPQGPMMVKLTNGAIADIQGQEQGVAEGYNDISVGDYVSYDDGPGTDRWEVVSIEGNRVELRNDQGGTTFADINDVLKEQGVAEGYGDDDEENFVPQIYARIIPGTKSYEIIKVLDSNLGLKVGDRVSHMALTRGTFKDIPKSLDMTIRRGVAEGSLNEWVDPGAPCQVCGKPHDQHRVKFNRKNPKLNFIKPDDEWNDLEMSNAEDHEYVPSKGYEPLSQREAELVGFDNLNVNMPDDIYNRINSVRQRISRVGQKAGQLTRVKEQGVAEGLTESGNYLYCQNPECGVYLGSLGGNWCPHCGWEANDDEQGVAKGSDTTTFNEFHEWKEAVYNLGADITQMGKAGQYTAIGSNGVIGEFNGRTNTGWIKGQQGVAEGYQEYDELRDKVEQILIKVYDKYGTRDQIIDVAKPMAQKVAQQMGLERYFDEIWSNALASHDVDTDFGDDDDDFDYTDYSMRKGERGMEEDDGVSKEKETEFHSKLDKLVHNTFGKRKGEMEGEDHPDHEISMASNELASIVEDAMRLLKLVKRYSEMEGLEAWQQSKITKAADYLNSVLNSLQGDAVFSKEDHSNFGNGWGQGSYDTYAGGRHGRGVAEGLRDPKDNPCWKGYKPVGTKKKGGRTVPNCVPKEGVEEGHDNYEFHTSVEQGEFLPSKFGNKRFVYLHDLEKKSPSTGGPQLVTIDDADTAKQIASHYGGKVVKTKLDTFRIVQPAEQGVSEGSEEREQNRLWQMITDYEKRAKATSNPIRKNHFLQMANELRGKLKTSDEQGVAEGASDYVGNAIEDLRVSMPGLDRESFLDELYSYIDAEYGKQAADAAFAREDDAMFDEWYASYTDMAEAAPKGYKSHKEDAYMAELAAKIAEKLDPNADVDVWIQDFQKADPNKYRQFKNKTPEKKAQMAASARYAAKNPSKK